MPDALDMVEKLRGVSYTLKATGKHEIGVIAEEVGAVAPEVDTYEANGKDARSVDYTRLTALLIEATKQQQAEIDGALKEIKVQRAMIERQQVAARRQVASIAALKAEVRSNEQSLRQVRLQLDSSHVGTAAEMAVR